MSKQTLISTEFGDTSMAKINSNFDELYTGKALDSEVVHLAGAEQISNGKSFYDIININSVGSGTNSIVRYYNTVKNWYVGLRGDTSNNWSIADDTDFRLVVTSSGNVGIATTSPTERLTVNGNVLIKSELIMDNGLADGTQVIFKSQGFNNIALGNSSGEFRVYNATLAQVWLTLTSTGDLTWKGQNWTSAWTSFSATPTWSGGTTNPSIIDNQASYKVIGKTLHFKIWIYSSGGDRTGATILLPFNVASTGRSVFTTWSSRDVKPFYAFAFNSQNYINCGSFTQGAGNNELIISGTCEIA